MLVCFQFQQVFWLYCWSYNQNEYITYNNKQNTILRTQSGYIIDILVLKIMEMIEVDMSEIVLLPGGAYYILKYPLRS